VRLPASWPIPTTAAICLARLIAPAGAIQIDHEVDRQTLVAMRHGSSFWSGMDQALRHIYGPAQSIRAFRMPTIFLVWRWVPASALWLLFVAMAALCGWLASRLSGRLWTMPVVATLMVTYGEGPGYTQYLLVEPWAVPFVLGSMVAYQRERCALAAGLALGAGLVREQAAALLVIGLAVAIVRRLPWRAWALGTVLWLAAFAVHVAAVSPHLVAHGHETPLIDGTHPIVSVLETAGFGLPLDVVAGVVVSALAAWAQLRRREQALYAGGYLGIPLVGLVVHRPYWGMLTVPVALAWATAGRPSELAEDEVSASTP
jgi:hypothetical protein